MLDYEKMTDGELVMASHNKDLNAEETLLQRYSRLVRKEIRFLFIVGADSDDLLQEGMIGLVKAIRDFRPGSDSTFMTFATICVRRQIRSAITASNRKKHIPLNSYISFYSGDDGDDLTNVLGQSETDNPENIILAEEKRAERYRAIENKLSAYEKKVLLLYLRGLSYQEIASELGKNEKSINNALTRIRLKLSER